MSFVNKSAWRSAQHDCQDLRRGYAHLSQGTRPSRKARNWKQLRRYLQLASIDNQGVIVVYKGFPGYPNRALIVPSSSKIQKSENCSMNSDQLLMSLVVSLAAGVFLL